MNSHGVIRVRLLGTPAIEGAGVDGRVVLRQPKRLTLLAHLAAQDGHVTRDTLVGLFWPGSDEDRARRALSQAIHFLRGELGRRAIATRGSADVAAGASVRCDVVEFDRAIRDQSWEAALALYGGDFLEGMVSPRGNELNQWIESERLRLQRLAVGAATALSDAAYQREDLAAAVSWQERALEINPFDEAALRMYLAVLDEAGDGAGALAAYDAFRTRLRARYDLEPSAETRRIVALIRGQRPDAVAAVPSPAKSDRPKQPRVRTVAGTRKRRSRVARWTRSNLRGLSVGAATVALLVSIFVLRRRPAHAEPGPLVENRVGVLYLNVNGEEQGLRYLADGLTEALISYLGQASDLEVVSANGVRPFRGKAVPPDTINSRLHAKILISGTVTQSVAGLTRVDIRLEDAENGSLSKTLQVESDSADLFRIIDDVTRQVGESLSPTLSRLVTLGQWRAGTESEEAFQALLQGSESAKLFDDLTRLGVRSRVVSFYENSDSLLGLAARLDPAWAEPHVLRGSLARGMAFVCMVDPGCNSEVDAWLDLAHEHADLALTAQPTDAGALELRGRAALERWIWDSDPDPVLLSGAENDLSDAVMLDRSRAGAWSARSALHFATADFSMAESAAEQALEEDAFLDDRAEIQWRLFQSAFHREHDLDAARWCAAVRNFQRGRWMSADCILNMMAWSDDVVADPDSAWRVMRNGLVADAEPIANAYRPRLELMVAAVIAKAGYPDSADAVIRRAVAAGRGDPELPYYEAGARVALGQDQAAVRLLRNYLRDAPAQRQHVTAFRWFKTIRNELNTVQLASIR